LPRSVRDSALETRSARSRLRAREWPYYRALEPGLHLGYRKPLAGAGVWVRRRYDSEAKHYRTDSLATADDYADADGREVLNFAQAQRKARAHRVAKGGVTVANALDAYLHHLEADGRSAAALRDARYRDAFIRSKLGGLELQALTADRLRRWRNELAKVPRRVRTAPGQEQKHRAPDGDDDTVRARRATANRIWTQLRAALNRAFEDGIIDNDTAWRRVKPFRGVDRARVRYLTTAEVKRLDNAIDPDFRPLLRAAFTTGARYGQLVGLRVADFDIGAHSLRLISRKGRGIEKVYRTFLSDEAYALFAQRCAGRHAEDLIFTRPSGVAWGQSHQIRLMQEASVRAGISPAVSFHVTRHTFASLAIMAGAPLLVVAQALGHADVRMVVAHYGHLAPDYAAQAIRDAAPNFGFAPSDRKIASLRPRP
jgi:integrase